MQKIKTSTDLKNAIQALEEKQAHELTLLKEQLLTTYENLQPLILLKNTFRQVISSSNIKDDIIGTTAGLSAGYLSKKIVSGNSHNPIKQLAGVLVQLGVSTIVSKNPETIKWLADKVLHLIIKNKKTSAENRNEHIF